MADTIKLSKPKCYQNILNLVEGTLVNNGYPLDLLTFKISERYNFLITQLYDNNTTDTVINKLDFFRIVTLPYTII